MQVYFIMDEQTVGLEQKHLDAELVEAETTNIKGYKGFDFFIFKHEQYKKWYICEYTTGHIVGWATSKANVKKHAKNMLDDKTEKNKGKLQEYIDNHNKINTT